MNLLRNIMHGILGSILIAGAFSVSIIVLFVYTLRCWVAENEGRPNPRYKTKALPHRGEAFF
jgi:hypothetical protein